MFGVVTRSLEDLDDPSFDIGFYEVKDVTGRRSDPTAEGINMVSCHGDTKASTEDELVALSETGEPATRERPYFDWGYVCPTHDGYREELLDLIDRCVEINGDLRLDDVGFPRQEYCYCERCNDRFAASDHSDRFAWRQSVITGFVEEAAGRIPGRTYLTVYPDPYPGHLQGRTGLEPAVIETYVDEIVVPIYDMAYSTTYWLEILAKGFVNLLSIPFSIELYAVDVELDNLIHAAEVAEAYADNVLFSYHASTAREAIDGLHAL